MLTQLTPAIQQAIASLNSGSVSRSVSVPSSRFSGAAGFTSSSGLGSSRLSSSRFSGAGSSRFSGATGSSGFSSGSRSSGASVSTITSSVVSQLQPSIAAAVAQALAGSRRSSSVSLGSANKEQEVVFSLFDPFLIQLSNLLSMPTAQLSTTLSTRSLMTSNRTTLPVRSPGSRGMRNAPDFCSGMVIL